MMVNENESKESPKSLQPLKMEEEHTGSIWTHPYMLYVVLTVVLFLILLGLGYLASENGWVPSRGL